MGDAIVWIVINPCPLPKLIISLLFQQLFTGKFRRNLRITVWLILTAISLQTHTHKPT